MTLIVLCFIAQILLLWLYLAVRSVYRFALVDGLVLLSLIAIFASNELP